MTNQEYFEKLHFEYELALMNYWIAAHRVFEEGDSFVDIKFFQDLTEAREKFEFLKSQHDKFISIVKTRKIDPNAQFKLDGY